MAEVEPKPFEGSVMCQVPPLPPHSPPTRLAGIDAARDHMAMVAMGGMGDVPFAELHKRGAADAFMADI